MQWVPVPLCTTIRGLGAKCRFLGSHLAGQSFSLSCAALHIHTPLPCLGPGGFPSTTSSGHAGHVVCGSPCGPHSRDGPLVRPLPQDQDLKVCHGPETGPILGVSGSSPLAPQCTASLPELGAPGGGAHPECCQLPSIPGGQCPATHRVSQVCVWLQFGTGCCSGGPAPFPDITHHHLHPAIPWLGSPWPPPSLNVRYERRRVCVASRRGTASVSLCQAELGLPAGVWVGSGQCSAPRVQAGPRSGAGGSPPVAPPARPVMPGVDQAEGLGSGQKGLWVSSARQKCPGGWPGALLGCSCQIPGALSTCQV